MMQRNGGCQVGAAPRVWCAALALALGFGDIAGKSRLEVPDGAPCCVTGVVTCVASWRANSGVLASIDDPNGFGVWFSGEVNAQVVSELAGMDALTPGMQVEIQGESSRLGFAPGIKASRIAFLGRGEAFPPPPVRRLGDFGWGVLDNRRVMVRAVLMDARRDSLAGYTRLYLATAGGEFIAHVPGAPDAWQGQVDSEMTLTGIAMSVFNIRGEYVKLQLEVVSPDDIKVEKSAPEAFSVPEVRLSGILPYASEPPDMHRRRVRGTVTHAGEDGARIYIQTQEGALRINARTESPDIAVGDEIEAAGFPRLVNDMGELSFAVVRKIGSGRRPDPVEIGWTELDGFPVNPDGSYRNLDARLVTVVARLLVVDGNSLAVEVDGVRVEVVLASPLKREILECAEAKPKLRITGVLSILQDIALPDGRVPAISARCIEVDGADDIALVADSNLTRWKRRRFGARCVAALAVAAALLSLVLFVRYVRSRQAYRRLDILARERKRMAGDLHDTIEQNLVAAKMLLKSSLSLSPETPENVKDAIVSVQEILMSAKAEIRERVFNLRNDELFKRSPASVVKSLARQISSHGVVRVRTALRGLPEALPAGVFSDILCIIREAATNAVKHGRAKTIFIVSDPAENGFVLRIANDGELFDPAAALGPEAGHFGLAGMRERAAKCGFDFSMREEKGMMTIRMEVAT